MTLKDEFEALSLHRVREFVSSSAVETLQLEFKRLSGESSMKKDDDRRNFARVMSGFANSSGGILIWGIDGRAVNGVDCAVEEVPVKNVAQLKSRLNELSGDAVFPRIEGIQHRAFDIGDGSGFVATFVPESNAGPHMAKLGDDRYYKRSGTSFYRMEHYDIADMFGRRKRPHLSVKAVSGASGIVLRLVNDGRGSAVAPFFAFSVKQPYKWSRGGVDGNDREGLPRLVSSGGGKYTHRYGGDANITIHPGTYLDVAAADIVTGYQGNRQPST